MVPPAVALMEHYFPSLLATVEPVAAGDQGVASVAGTAAVAAVGMLAEASVLSIQSPDPSLVAERHWD